MFTNVLPSFPSGIVTAVTTLDPDIENAESWQGSVQVERELARGLSVAGYAMVKMSDPRVPEDQ